MLTAIARKKRGSTQELHIEGEAIDLATRTIKAFNLHGLVNVQMKERHSDGSLALLEVNPRMSGGCIYTTFAGVNLPYLAVALELGLIANSDLPQPIGGQIVAATPDAIRLNPSPQQRLSELNLKRK